MTAFVDASPWGARAPGAFDRAVLALTRSLPANNLGLRLAMLFRRATTTRLGKGALDTTIWESAKLRLYPVGNGCEKSALFTPQMFDLMETRALGPAVDRAVAEGRTFHFVDIGANVGLYSFFVSARAGGRARCVAIEPQPGILDRLMFNRQLNPDFDIQVFGAAVGEDEGTISLVINDSDSGGTHQQNVIAARAGERTVEVPRRTLTGILAEAGVTHIDALKIDIEGAEDQAMAPFLRDAPRALLPRLLLIEDTRDHWKVDLHAMLVALGYTVVIRNPYNVIYRLD
jgi:FkbM family methyltransferase